ncbi:MAG TPA: cysteine desulfurase-like protein [Actinomycetota bacterium]|jgi:cysteine desulfurase family protein (TIGR01976 family)|nr:cysteine desulfurase-like protein [Actinomycetota bacterium]
MGVDLSRARDRFPGLHREVDGRPVVFADAPGGSQVPDEVVEATAAYLRRSNANAHGAFATSQETDDVIADAHRAAADLLNADPDEVVFGPNATTLLFAISRSIARTLEPGDEVVVTRLDHDANVRPWVFAAEDAGATVRWVDVRVDDVTLDPDSFVAALSERTKLVAFSLASNAVGTVTPAAELVRLVHERTGGLVACDGVHLAQHHSIDVREIGADLVVCSPYKIFGPHLGILFGRREVLSSLRPYKVRPAEDALPFAFETGTQNHEGFAGWVAAVGYLASLGAGSTRREAVAEAFGRAIVPWEADLSRRFLDGLSSIPRVRLFGIAETGRVSERTPTFAIRVGDQHPAETAKALAERGVYVWDGNYYALEIMERLGLEDSGGAVRVGFCHYNTPAEVDRVLDELESIAR